MIILTGVSGGIGLPLAKQLAKIDNVIGIYKKNKPVIKIKNVNEEDADDLKNYLIEHVNKQEFIFSYEWSKGDICLWDNLSILHMASEIKNCKRIMHRITIK